MLVKYKWVFIARIVAVCLIISAVSALVFIENIQGRKSDSAFVLTAAPSAQAAEMNAARSSVIRWMKINSEMPEQVLSNIYDTALQSMHPDLVLAICMVESNFNPWTRSHKGAIGLMGVRPAVWLKELKTHGIVHGKRDLYLVSKNIASGAYVLGKYIARSGDVKQALFDYVGGDYDYVGKVLQAVGEISLIKNSRNPDGIKSAGGYTFNRPLPSESRMEMIARIN